MVWLAFYGEPAYILGGVGRWRGNLSLENRMCVLYNGAKEFRGDGQYHYLEGSVQDED